MDVSSFALGALYACCVLVIMRVARDFLQRLRDLEVSVRLLSIAHKKTTEEATA